MAIKAVTPDGEAYCSSCHFRVGRDDAFCQNCREDLIGVMDASLCGSCGDLVTIDMSSCRKCGAVFNPVKIDGGFSEEEFLRRMLQWQSLQQQAAKLAGAPNGVREKPPGMASSISAQIATKPLPDNLLWRLSEPVERMVSQRIRRLEQLDSMILDAKRRIDAIEGSTDASQQEERKRLKQWVEEILAERNDILALQESMTEMERIYRNILVLQQTELQTKEESIRIRLETFHAEIERIEKEKAEIKEKEAEIERKEDELRVILDRIGEKERELAALEEKLKSRAVEAELQKKKLEETEKQLAKDKWMTEHNRHQSQLLEMRGDSIVVEPGPENLGEFSSRINELEEQLEKVADERNRLLGERRERVALMGDLNRLLRTLDELLGHLSPDVIRRFAKSEDYKLYERILQKLGV